MKTIKFNIELWEWQDKPHVYLLQVDGITQLDKIPKVDLPLKVHMYL